ncbi:MAG: hypothetical protein FRX48_09015 [Lasallia pustulata]|uniref:Uncharacterized protein n=1 Tax=Lasallia pustulata TaxID=136370 RepID=A0A5M8PDR8_9LECA|nr:MAG: hypothetical protein FRX48_09015 [Lasallia pustulata]
MNAARLVDKKNPSTRHVTPKDFIVQRGEPITIKFQVIMQYPRGNESSRHLGVAEGSPSNPTPTLTQALWWTRLKSTKTVEVIQQHEKAEMSASKSACKSACSIN